jgi:hypothetical protein
MSRSEASHRSLGVVLALFVGAFFVGSARADGTLTVKYVGCTGMTVSPSPPPAGSMSVLVYSFQAGAT